MSKLIKAEDDQIQLLYRNALQLLSIVKETFPHDSYSSNTPPAYCENPSSTTDELACLWQDAMKHLHNRPWVAELAQEPLLRVSSLPEHEMFRSLIASVLLQSSGQPEQYC